MVMSLFDSMVGKVTIIFYKNNWTNRHCNRLQFQKMDIYLRALKTICMLLLGIDLGTSSIKVAVVDAAAQRTLVTAQYPDVEAAILTRQPGWAEQSPETWWEYVQQAIRKVH